MRQGTRANFTGKQLEGVIDGILKNKGYTLVKTKDFPILKEVGSRAAEVNERIFSRQYPLCKSVYDTDIKCDFVLYYPQKHSDGLVIEAKWQQSGGSVDEKYPFLVLNIKEKYPYPTVIVLDGGGYKKTAEEWLRAQVDSKLIHVFNMQEFLIWANGEDL